MNKLALIFAFVVALSFGAESLKAQDSALGALPPIPELDLGDPERKLSWSDKRKARKAEREREYRERTYTRTEEDTGRATVRERLNRAAEKRREEGKTAEYRNAEVHNSIGSRNDAYTPTGDRLKPFGEEYDYWAGMPEPAPEETIIELPPIPDLRADDQITKKEKLRRARLAKMEARKAAETERRALKEAQRQQIAAATGPIADPLSAQAIVHSQGEYGGGYVGNQQVPQTVENGNLKPFDSNSEYYQGSQLVYKGNDREKPVEYWWKRGTTEQGGPADARPKFAWDNPFGGRQDEVQPVSFTHPDGSVAHSAAVSPTADPTPLTSNLRGIRVVDSTGAVLSGRVTGISGVQSLSVDLPPKVYAELEARIGSPLTLGGLNQMVRDAVTAYRRSDLPVVDVLVPEQEITTGVLQLVIIEGRLGDVIVEGMDRHEGRKLASQIRTEHGEVIRESELAEDLNWINKHPTRQVDLIFSPGDEYGETDVILRSEEYKALSAFIAYENSGTSVLGESRAIAGVSWTGPLFTGLDSILSYQFTTNFDNSDASVVGHTGVFSTYLPWRHQLTLLGAHVTTSAALEMSPRVFDSSGQNEQITARYAIPLPNIGRVTHELELGMDFKSSNSALGFGGAQFFDTTTEIVQYSIGYNIVAQDRSGIWTVDTEIVNSPGESTNKNRDSLFNSQRADASAQYTYGRVMIQRDQELPNGWSLMARVRGQASNSNLLSTETLGAGGFDSVRGFEQSIIRGDSGVVGTVELRTPTFYPSTFAGYNNVQDGAIGLIFYDGAALRSVDPLPGETDRNLGSIGVGFRYQRAEWFTLRVDYGFQITEDGFDDGNQGRWHVGARATF